MSPLRTTAALALLAALAPAPDASGQTVSMVTTVTKVVESPGALVQVEVEISSDPSTYVTVSWITKGGSATPDVDYSQAAGKIYFMPEFGEPVQTIYLSLLGDDIPEGPESFFVVLTDVAGGGVTLGQPTVTEVIIIDDDDGNGEPVASIDTGDAFPNDEGVTYLYGRLGGQIPVTIRLDRVPVEPYEVFYSLSWPPFGGSVIFDDTDERVVIVDVPNTEPHALGTFSLVAGGQTRGVPIGLGGFNPFEICLACGFYYLGCATGYIFPCEDECGLVPKPAPRTASWAARASRALAGFFGMNLDVLRQYRDEVLAKTPAGQFYTQQYDMHSAAIGAALLAEPTMPLRLLAMQGPWLAGIEAVVFGVGDGATITQEMETQLNELLDRLEAVGSPELVAAIQLERTRLSLDDLAGLTMAQLQTRIETDGGTPTRSMSWGEVKNAFR